MHWLAFDLILNVVTLFCVTDGINNFVTLSYRINPYVWQSEDAICSHPADVWRHAGHPRVHKNLTCRQKPQDNTKI